MNITLKIGQWFAGLALVMASGAGGQLTDIPALGGARLDRNAAAKALAELRTAVAESRPGIPAPTVPGALPVASASLRETYLAFAALQAEKAHDYLNGAYPDRTQANHCVETGRLALAEQNPIAPVTLIQHGRLVENAYFAANDGSPQPYFVYEPEGRKPGEQLPLVLFLHGYVPETSRTDPYLLNEFVMDLADKHRMVLALPHGRTNTDFQFAGEVDVLRVKRKCSRFYGVDPERIYLLGVSMGGAGAWQVAVHYPDQFAATAPINGQADWFRFWSEHFNYPSRDRLPPHIAYMISLNNPLDLVGNLKNLYSYSQQAVSCFVGIHHTRAMVSQLKAIGAPFATFEDPSELGHYIYWRADCWQRAFEHLVGKVRTPPPPAVRFTTYSLRFPGAYGYSIERISEWGKPASFEVRIPDAGGLDIRAENVAVLRAEMPADWEPPATAKWALWNGTAVAPVRVTADGTAYTVTAPDAPKPGKHPKTTAVCGPLHDVFNFPFVVVVGTAGSEADTAANTALAASFVENWAGYAEGRPRVVTDTEVTEQLIKDAGLVLIGLPETNAMIRKIAKDLPFQLSRETISLPDGQHFPTPGTGLWLTYPNPLNPQRYVVIRNGLPWGEARSANHKFDRIPDFSIFARDSLPGIGSNRFLAAGLFDANWQYDAELTDVPKAPAPATLFLPGKGRKR